MCDVIPYTVFSPDFTDSYLPLVLSTPLTRRDNNYVNTSNFSCRATNRISNYALDTSSKMATRPLKFPNLITGYQRNPVHASQAALYTRYTPHEWFQKQVRYYNEADSRRHYSERMRGDALRIIRYDTVSCEPFFF